MQDATQLHKRQASTPIVAPVASQDDQVQYLIDFLDWLKKTHGLSLCQPFKPQFDWYMPALANNSKLASQFASEKKSADLNKPQRCCLI